MRINGLERNEAPVGAVSQDSGVTLPSRPHEHLRVQAFRRALLIVENNSQLSDAFDAAHNLVDQATGEIVILKSASENRQTLNVAELPDWLTRTNKIDILEIRRRSLDAASIDEITQEYGFDLVVLTMESQDNERRLLKGCATEAIFRRLKCPSLILGPKAVHLPTCQAQRRDPKTRTLPYRVWSLGLCFSNQSRFRQERSIHHTGYSAERRICVTFPHGNNVLYNRLCTVSRSHTCIDVDAPTVCAQMQD